MANYKAIFHTDATAYLYYEVEEGEDPGVKLDQLLEEGELEVPELCVQCSNDFELSDLTLDGWEEE